MKQKLAKTNHSMKLIWGGAALVLVVVIVALANNPFVLLLVIPYMVGMGVMIRKMRSGMPGMGGGEHE